MASAREDFNDVVMMIIVFECRLSTVFLLHVRVTQCTLVMQPMCVSAAATDISNCSVGDKAHKIDLLHCYWWA